MHVSRNNFTVVIYGLLHEILSLRFFIHHAIKNWLRVQQVSLKHLMNITAKWVLSLLYYTENMWLRYPMVKV